jgi:hypothetical protein
VIFALCVVRYAVCAMRGALCNLQFAALALCGFYLFILF